VSHATGCAAAPANTGSCPRCDLLLGLDAVHVEVRVQVVWRQRVWRCAEQVPALVTARG
jgi:hypothetical protein